MSDISGPISNGTPGESDTVTTRPATSSVPSPLALPPALQNLGGDAKAEIYSLIASVTMRSLTGPDPETAKIAAQSEMHEETCRLEGYKEALRIRDRQGERDHEFRKQRLIFDTVKNFGISIACLVGIGVGLYLYIAKGDKTLGSNIVIACFVTLLGGKTLFQKDKE
jgi:hypothetical protein